MDYDNNKWGFETPENFRLLREIFSRAGYDAKGITELFGGWFPTAPTAVDMQGLVRQVRGHSPLETLVRLFLLNVPVDAKTAQQILKPIKLEQCAGAGILKLGLNRIKALIKIIPFHGLLIGTEANAGNEPDRVMGIGGSTTTLVNFSIRRQSKQVLDLGTGCGVQALLAAGHSERVYATDINPRALNLARFNAKLNGISNVTFLTGDLFAPVQKKKFDLILFNPPFVISPEERLMYQDSGMRGDGFIQKILNEVPGHLKEGGYCQIICHWANLPGHKWQDRLATWFDGNGCDTWVIRRKTIALSDYVKSWISSDINQKELAAHHKRWMDYYEKENIEAIGLGLITMRRRTSGANWYRSDDWTDKIDQPIGEDILNGFGTQDFLESASDDSVLLKARLRVSPCTRLEQQCEPSEGGWRVVSAQLRRLGGLTYSDAVEPSVASLVVRCDGQHAIGELLADLSGTSRMNRAEITTAYLPVVRRLIARGILQIPSN